MCNNSKLPKNKRSEYAYKAFNDSRILLMYLANHCSLHLV